MAIRVYLCLLFVAGATATLSGQTAGQADSGRVSVSDSTRRYNFRGRVTAASGIAMKELRVELCDQDHDNRIVDRTPVSDRGEFSFSGVPDGAYAVRVTGESGAVLGEQFVGSAAHVRRLEIRVEPRDGDNPYGGAISVAELKHKVPGKALKEAKLANKALARRDVPALILHLQKAIALDPQFIAARRNLSLAYLTTMQYQRAIDSFQELLVLDSRCEIGYVGLSAIYVAMNRPSDAEVMARRALEIDASDKLSHYLLGCSLAAQDKNRDEALLHLSKAYKAYPQAQVVAASILARQGRKDEAKVRLQDYLESGDNHARSEAQEMLTNLY